MRHFVMMIAILAITSAFAKTVYVNCQLDDYTGHDGSTPELAVKTLAEGYKKTVSGDSIEVAPGVYNEGVANENHWWGVGRIYLGRKVYLYASSSNPADTVIEGSFGEDRVKCILVEGENAAQSIIKGFTLRNGYSDRYYWNNGVLSESPAACNGSALHSSTGGTGGFLAGPYLEDCVIENCCATSVGLAVGGTFVRCKIGQMDATPATYFVNNSTFINCTFSGIKKNSASSAVDYSNLNVGNCKFVNCSFFGSFAGFWYTNNDYIYNCLFSAFYNNGSAENFTKAASVTDDVNSPSMISTVTGDYRLRTGSAATTAGDASYLADLGLPSEGEGSVWNVDPYVDIDGNAIAKSGAIAVGATQTTATPAYGTLVLSSTLVDADGTIHPSGSYLVPDAWPKSYRFGNPFPSAHRVVDYRLTWDGTTYDVLPQDPADTNDYVDVLPPRLASDPVLKLMKLVTTTQVKWADPDADSTTADGTEEHPYATLQAAMDALAAAAEGGKGIIIAKPGIYQPGPNDEGVSTCMYCDHNGKFMLKHNAGSHVRLVGLEGAEKTFIKGRPDPDTGTYGANAVQGIFGGNGGGIHVQGFTFTGCYSSSDDLSDPYWGPGRSVCYSYIQENDFVDCIFSNNVCAAYCIAGRLCRCKILNNTAKLGIVAAGTLTYACVLAGNTTPGTLYQGGYNSDTFQYVIGCSIGGNSCSSTFYNNNTIRVVNTVVANGGAAVYSAAEHYGCVYDGFTTWNEGHYLKANPYFVDTASADLRMGGMSDGLKQGVSASDANGQKWLLTCSRDINYNLVKAYDDGSVLPGAYATSANGVYVDGGANGGLAVTNGKIGFNELTGAQTITVTAAAGTRPVSGVTTNGVAVDFESMDGHALTFTPMAGNVSVLPVYTTTWYCAPDGTESAAGGYPSAAKSMKAALTLAVSGDTVKALAGTYDSGTMIQDGTYSAGGVDYPYAVRARGLVKTGVTLESVAGREETIIKGAAATILDAKYEHAPDAAGMGEDAIRCLYLEAQALAKGFTLSDGHTRERLADGSEAHSHVETSGGAVYSQCTYDKKGNDTMGTVEDCIITNNVAFRGGGVYGARVVNSIVCCNTGCYIGGAMEGGKAYGTLVYGNNIYFPWNNANRGCYDMKHANHCTFLDALIIDSGWTTFINCLCYKVSLANETPQVFNCIFSSDSGADPEKFPEDSGCVVIAADKLACDANYRPIVGANKAIDFGSIAASESEPDFLSKPDVLGGQRIYNGTIDAGALEADWRATYSTDLHRNQVTVTAASAMTEEIGETKKSIQLPDGATFAFTLRQASAQVSVPIKVADGTLTVTVDGVPTTYTEDVTIKLGSALAAQQIGFAYVGTGTAEIGSFKTCNGMAVFLQ